MARSFSILAKSKSVIGTARPSTANAALPVPVDKNLLNVEGRWELFDAIGEGDALAVTEILTQSDSKMDLLRTKDMQGLTALRKAIALGKANIARILVSFGAEPSRPDPLGKTPLHWAAIQGRRDLIAPLLTSADSNVNVQDTNGWTPLHYAVRGNHFKAAEWLLYAGADVELHNNAEKSPLALCEEDSPMSQLLMAKKINLETNPVELCCAFIGKKRLNKIGPDGRLLFLTSNNWCNIHRFLFNKRIRPCFAQPKIPLRPDELFFADVCHYRMMRRLKDDERRVKAYFILFEELHGTQIVLKITSKTKYLGEVPLTITTSVENNYTVFLASAEIELKDEGQFVLVKRFKSLIMTKDNEGVLVNSQHPNVKVHATWAFPICPKDWQAMRQRKERDETEAMLKKMEREALMEHTEEDKIPVLDENANAENEDDPGKETETASEILEDPPELDGVEGEKEITPGDMLTGYEPDECSDFYFISKGWGLFLMVRRPIPINMVTEKRFQDRPLIRCNTLFYTISHTNKNFHPEKQFTMVIPKNNAFAKEGTVLVFARKNPAEDEPPIPDPGETADEFFISEDGKSTWGSYWLQRERERWELVPSGIVNKQTRVIFRATALTTYIAVELLSGTQKWIRELPGDDSSEEEEEDEENGSEDGQEKAEEEGGSEAQTDNGDQGGAKKKKRKKSKKENLSDDSGEPREDEESSSDEICKFEENKPLEETAEEGNLPEEENPGTGGGDEETGAPQSSPMPETQNENPNNITGFQSQSTNKNNSAAEMRRSNLARVGNASDDDPNLSPEERTLIVNLPPLGSSFAELVSLSEMDEKPKQPPPDSPFPPGSVEPSAPGTGKATATPEPESEEAELVTDAEPEDVEDRQEDAEEVESDEDLPEVLPKQEISMDKIVWDETFVQPYQFGPDQTEMANSISEHDMLQITTEIASMWRHRNSRSTTLMVFSKPKSPNTFEMVIELIKTADITVRAEHWWSEGYSLVTESPEFPIKTGRLFSFTMEGNVTIAGPIENPPGKQLMRTMYYYASKVNYLYFVVRRPVQEEVKTGGPKKGRKKEEVQKDVEPDLILEVNSYPNVSVLNGAEVFPTQTIFLNGPNLWNERHVALRSDDDTLLRKIKKCLRKDISVTDLWWILAINLGVPEIEVEKAKGKNEPDFIVEMFVQKWFDTNLNAFDRGIHGLIQVLLEMERDAAITRVVMLMKAYKARLLLSDTEPRYKKVLFHWLMQTKITKNNLLRMIEPQVLKPVSDLFLLKLSYIIAKEDLSKIGSCMDVEENVLHSISQEEIITHPAYLPFRVLVKSRQKKDEIIHYTLLLMNLVSQLENKEAGEFVEMETRKWMTTVARTDPDTCAKLANVFS